MPDPSTSSGHGAVPPRVGIVMGSDSDWPVMEAAAAACAEFGVPYEADVVSAHRMPTEMIDYGRRAHERGLRVVIAGAGGAARGRLVPGRPGGGERMSTPPRCSVRPPRGGHREGDAP